MSNIEDRILNTITEIPNFPKEGILFKDINPLFLHPVLVNDMADEIIQHFKQDIDAICCIESRGFFLGVLLAQKLNVPLIPVRKKGKLPGEVFSYTYDLEYGTATLELQKGIVKPHWKILIHDDILATGGTAMAAAELLQMEKATIAGFAFIADLSFLNGRQKLEKYQAKIINLANF